MLPRTLVISDLHIGTPDDYSVIERPEALAALVAEVKRSERLVLLGDLVELQHADAERSFTIAEPILRALGEAVGRGNQIVFVPGNHDRALIRSWIRAQGTELTRDGEVPLDASQALRRVIDPLAAGGAMLSVHYPGVWLTDRIWAHHGHYLNHYLRPHQAYGLMLKGRRPGARATEMRPSDYEPRRRRDPQIQAQAGAHHHESPIVPDKYWHSHLHDRLLHAHLSPITSYMLGRQVRHHAIPAMARVARTLGVDAEYVIFGHVHRRGPMAGDRFAEWKIDGHVLVNTGSWRWEPVLVGLADPPHPYWPGGAVLIESDGVPRTIDLLERLDRTVLVRQTSTGVKATE